MRMRRVFFKHNNKYYDGRILERLDNDVFTVREDEHFEEMTVPKCFMWFNVDDMMTQGSRPMLCKIQDLELAIVALKKEKEELAHQIDSLNHDEDMAADYAQEDS